MGKAAAWADNDRLRIDGARSLVDAALAGSVHSFIYPSVVLVYPDSGQAWIEAQRTQRQPIAFRCSTMDAEAQVRRFAEAGRRGITLRMGNFYGPESGHTQDTLAYAARASPRCSVGQKRTSRPSGLRTPGEPWWLRWSGRRAAPTMWSTTSRSGPSWCR